VSTADIDDTDDTTHGDLDHVLRTATRKARPHATKGKVATYIPALADVDPHQFAMAAVEMDGTEHTTGDADVAFPIQSVSKVFSLVLAMQKADAADGVKKELWRRVGVEPSGDPFNSLVQLEHHKGVPRNPMINPGALIVDDVLLDHCEDPKREALDLLSELAGEQLEVDEDVRDGEIATSHRNRAIANLMADFGNLTHSVDDVLESYTYQCSIMMSSRQLARASRFLANDGIDPATGREVLSPRLARRVAAVMLTCGTYDAAGEFAFNVGLPCKSGVAGSIISLVPDRMGVCVWSPPLDRSGNSLAGRVALRELSAELGLTIF
jgi:glutaminase